MTRSNTHPRRNWQQIARSIPNREKEEERQQDMERFNAEVPNEKKWLVKQVEELDGLITALSREVELVQEILDQPLPQRAGTSRLSPLTLAGRQHLLRKRMLRHSAKLDAVLGEIHHHPVFRDVVVGIPALQVPEETLPAERDNAFGVSRALMPLLEQLNRLLDGLYRLRRRMQRELLRSVR